MICFDGLADALAVLPNLTVRLGLGRIISFIQKLAGASQSAGVFSSTQALSYWSYHLARSGFFTIQGLAGGILLPHTASSRCCIANGFKGSAICVVWPTTSKDVPSAVLYLPAASGAALVCRAKLKSSSPPQTWSPDSVIILWTVPASCASLFKPSQLSQLCFAGLAARNASVAQGNTGDGVNTEKKGVDFGKVIESGLNGPLTEALASYYVVSRHI